MIFGRNAERDDARRREVEFRRAAIVMGVGGAQGSRRSSERAGERFCSLVKLFS